MRKAVLGGFGDRDQWQALDKADHAHPQTLRFRSREERTRALLDNGSFVSEIDETPLASEQLRKPGLVDPAAAEHDIAQPLSASHPLGHRQPQQLLRSNPGLGEQTRQRPPRRAHRPLRLLFNRASGCLRPGTVRDPVLITHHRSFRSRRKEKGTRLRPHPFTVLLVAEFCRRRAPHAYHRIVSSPRTARVPQKGENTPKNANPLTPCADLPHVFRGANGADVRETDIRVGDSGPRPPLRNRRVTAPA